MVKHAADLMTLEGHLQLLKVQGKSDSRTQASAALKVGAF